MIKPKLLWKTIHPKYGGPYLSLRAGAVRIGGVTLNIEGVGGRHRVEKLLPHIELEKTTFDSRDEAKKSLEKGFMAWYSKLMKGAE